MNLLKKGILAATLAASAFVSAAPAQARDHYRRGGNDDAAIAIGAGVVGLALGAAIASDRNDRYYDDGYYRPRYRTQHYYNNYPAYPVYRRNYYNYRAYPAYRGYNYRHHDNRGWRDHRGYRGRRGW